MSKTKVEIILTLPNRISAKLAMVKALGIRKALAYSGPTFTLPDDDSTGVCSRWSVGHGAVIIRPDDTSRYFYPLSTVARVKVTKESK